jgi:hypothetical protein
MNRDKTPAEAMFVASCIVCSAIAAVCFIKWILTAAN